MRLKMQFNDYLDEQIRLEHKVAIYAHLVKYLDAYTENDLGEREKLVDMTCICPEIGQEAVRAVLSELNDLLALTRGEVEQRKHVKISRGG